MSAWLAAAQIAADVGTKAWEANREKSFFERGQIFNATEAQKQRDWATNMSNTAFQRAAKDLQAAGLNRILALGSPAATPGGAAATSPAGSVSPKKIDVMNAMLMQEQINSAKAAQNLTNQQARLTGAQADKEEFTKRFYKEGKPLLDRTIESVRNDAPKVWNDYKRGLGVIGDKVKEVYQGPVKDTARDLYHKSKAESAKAIKELRREYEDIKEKIYEEIREYKYGKKNPSKLRVIE